MYESHSYHLAATATLEQVLQQVVLQQQHNQMQQQFLHFVAQHAQTARAPDANTGSGGRLTYLRGLGGPPTCAGEHEKHREWMAKLANVIAAKNTSFMARLGGDTDRVHHRFRHQVVLRAEISLGRSHDCTQGRAWEDGNGLDAHHVLKNRYETRIAGTKRAVLKQIARVKSANRADDVEHKIRHFEDLVRRYDCLAGVAFPEDLMVTLWLEV